MDSYDLSTETRSLEEGDPTRPILQPTTTGGRLSQSPLLQDNLRSLECSNEETHRLGMFWSSPSMNLANLQMAFSSSHFGQLPDLTCFE